MEAYDWQQIVPLGGGSGVCVRASTCACTYIRVCIYMCIHMCAYVNCMRNG